jgi:hypothetical protein
MGASGVQTVSLSDGDGSWIATFTPGARTVRLAGPGRVFAERGVSVAHEEWVRALPMPFAGTPDGAWLAAARAANDAGEPDILAIAMQYVRGAPLLFANELQIAGDAGYGPVQDGQIQEGADFNDYLGVPWQYPGETTTREPQEKEFRCLDCSGFVRMVWGYRVHAPNTGPLGVVPLSFAKKAGHLPRTARQICAHKLGVLVVPDGGATPTDLSPLAIGDLVFFDADGNDGTKIDHLGIYIGVDGQDGRRFISSRKSASAPTLADWQSPSLLDGGGHFATSLRAVRRL